LIRLLVLSALALSVSGAARAAASQEVLRVGMDPRSAPWAYVPGLSLRTADFTKPPELSGRQKARLEGIEIDMMRLLAGKLGVRAEVVPYAWAENENGLVSGAFDVLLDSWTPRPTTPDEIVASDPYWEWGLVFVTRADEKRFMRVQELAEARLGYSPDPATERALRGMGIDRLIPQRSSVVLFEELLAGRVDAAIEDSTYVAWRQQHDKTIRVVGEPLNQLGYHVGVRRSDASLLARVNAAIHALRESGELSRLRAKWTGPARP
jgi:ABC-type amino acid transport substrate-binding protein